MWMPVALRVGSQVDSCGNAVPDYRIPGALDWFSTDIYHMDGVVEGWVDTWVRSFYERLIFPNLTDTQRVVLVPGSFGRWGPRGSRASCACLLCLPAVLASACLFVRLHLSPPHVTD